MSGWVGWRLGVLVGVCKCNNCHVPLNYEQYILDEYTDPESIMSL